MSEPARHGIVRDHVQLHELMRALADKRNIARRTLDDLAGLTIGYSERVLAQVPQKRIGMDSLFPLLWALGARLVIEDDPENLARIADHLNGRRSEKVSAPVLSTRVKTASVLRKMAREEAVKIRRQQMRRALETVKAQITPEQRSAIARHAAITRHKRERAARKARRNAPNSPSRSENSAALVVVFQPPPQPAPRARTRSERQSSSGGA